MFYFQFLIWWVSYGDFSSFLGNVVFFTHKRFQLVYCVVAIVIVCHFVRSLMAFVCQEIKRLLTYLLTYLAYISIRKLGERGKLTESGRSFDGLCREVVGCTRCRCFVCSTVWLAHSLRYFCRYCCWPSATSVLYELCDVPIACRY